MTTRCCATSRAAVSAAPTMAWTGVVVARTPRAAATTASRRHAIAGPPILGILSPARPASRRQRIKPGRQGRLTPHGASVGKNAMLLATADTADTKWHYNRTYIGASADAR